MKYRDYVEILEISRNVIISRGLHLQTLFLMWFWISIKNAFQPYIILLYVSRFIFHFPIWRHRMWKRKIQFSSKDFIFRPCFYCDSESARRDGFNGIHHDYIWNEKYFFNYDIIRYSDVISGTLQKWPYCYFENLTHTNSYPTIRLQITFCTRLPGPKKCQKRAFSPITPRIWDFSDEFSKIGREPIKPSGMMWTDKIKSANGHNFPNGHNNETDYMYWWIW